MKQLEDLYKHAIETRMHVGLVNCHGVITPEGDIATTAGTLVLGDESNPVIVSIHFANDDGKFSKSLPEFGQAVEMLDRMVRDGAIE